MGNIVDIWDKFILPMLGALGGGLAAYVSIRSSLATLMAQVAILEKSVDRAHARIDDIHRGKG